MANLDAVAAVELIGELSKAAEQIRAGAFDVAAVTGGEVVAIAEIEIAEKFEPLVDALRGEPVVIVSLLKL